MQFHMNPKHCQSIALLLLMCALSDMYRKPIESWFLATLGGKLLSNVPFPQPNVKVVEKELGTGQKRKADVLEDSIPARADVYELQPPNIPRTLTPRDMQTRMYEDRAKALQTRDAAQEHSRLSSKEVWQARDEQRKAQKQTELLREYIRVNGITTTNTGPEVSQNIEEVFKEAASTIVKLANDDAARVAQFVTDHSQLAGILQNAYGRDLVEKVKSEGAKLVEMAKKVMEAAKHPNPELHVQRLNNKMEGLQTQVKNQGVYIMELQAELSLSKPNHGGPLAFPGGTAKYTGLRSEKMPDAGVHADLNLAKTNGDAVSTVQNRDVNSVTAVEIQDAGTQTGGDCKSGSGCQLALDYALSAMERANEAEGKIYASNANLRRAEEKLRKAEEEVKALRRQPTSDQTVLPPATGSTADKPIEIEDDNSSAEIQSLKAQLASKDDLLRCQAAEIIRLEADNEAKCRSNSESRCFMNGVCGRQQADIARLKKKCGER